MSALDEILQLLDGKDSAAAIEMTARNVDPVTGADSFHECMKTLYWKRKDLVRCIAIGRAGVTFALTRALDAESRDEAQLALELRSIAKAMSYDIASFTWDGWGEAGITITTSDLAVGLDAAKANLRLAHELNKGDLPLSRAWWMLGSHQLSAGDRVAAAKSYREAERHAAAAGSKADELLNNAFGHLVAVLAAPDAAEARQRLDAILKQLHDQKDGPAFADQVQTAQRVLAARR